MCQSMHWHMRFKCWMLCCQSLSILYLFAWLHWQPISWLLWNTKEYVFLVLSISFLSRWINALNFNCLFPFLLYFKKKKAPIAIQNPCIPSPCGAYSQCRESNGHAICSCVEYCIGSPPSCRPECTLSSECFLDKACINQRCVNPCVPGTCGDHARCQVINHNPICSCSLGYTGDPFIRCTPEESKLFGVISLPFIGKLSLRSYSVGRWKWESFEWVRFRNGVFVLTFVQILVFE